MLVTRNVLLLRASRHLNKVMLESQDHYHANTNTDTELDTNANTNTNTYTNTNTNPLDNCHTQHCITTANKMLKEKMIKLSFDLIFIFQLYLATLNSLVSLQVGVLNPIASTAIKICIVCH